MTLRVVNLGLPKTGTTTFSRALKTAGLKTADHRIRRYQTENANLHGAFVADVMYRGYFNTGDPAAEFTDFGAISEMSVLRVGRSLWPQMDFAIIDALRRLHPDLRFVATKRPVWDISQSMLGWSNLGTDRLPHSAIPGLPPGYGETSKQRETWITAHYAHLTALLDGDQRYLELDVTREDAAEVLGAHVGMDIPWWGHVNKGRVA